LDWDYKNKHLDISIPGYVQKRLKQYNHPPKRPQHCPYSPLPIKYGAAAQDALPHDVSKPLDEKGKHRIQKVWGVSYIMAEHWI